MSIVVMKFGGTSVADADRIRAAARRAIDTRKAGHQVVMVVSAMGDTTDHLVDLAAQITDDPLQAGDGPAPGHRRAGDDLADGDGAGGDGRRPSASRPGRSAWSPTTCTPRRRIKTIDVRRIHEQLDAGRIVIVAGFQGVTAAGARHHAGPGRQQRDAGGHRRGARRPTCARTTPTWTASTPPTRGIVPNARKIDRISYDEMLELASLGANVLHNRAVEFAKKYDVPIHVRSSLTTGKER